MYSETHMSTRCIVDGSNWIAGDKHQYLERHGWEQAETGYWFHDQAAETDRGYTLSEALRMQARREQWGN